MRAPDSTGLRAAGVDSEYLSPEDKAVLAILAESRVPRGARVITRDLHKLGHSVSEATVSRILVRLDKAGLTASAGSKGRVLSEQGRVLAGEIDRNRNRVNELSGALDIQHIDQLIDLLRARRGLEREIIMLVAERAEAQDFADLESALSEHRSMVAEESYKGHVANHFHKILVRCSRSALFEALSSVVLYDALDALDPLLLVVTSFHGTVSDAPNEHRAVLEALRRRDGAEAQRLLDAHLSRLIKEVEEFKHRDGEGVFTNLLTLAQASV